MQAREDNHEGGQLSLGTL